MGGQNLHQVIQIVMGWENAHLHDFEVRGRRYSEFEEDIQSGAGDSTAVTLRSLKLNRKGHTFLYTYDFGDSWRHEIVVEAPRPTDESVKLPVWRGASLFVSPRGGRRFRPS